MDTPPQAFAQVQKPARGTKLLVAVWVLSAFLVIASVVLVGTFFVNQAYSDGLARAYKKPLHVVESQLQLDDVGQVVVEREFDNTVKVLWAGGAVMQANIAITGTDVNDKLKSRLRSLGYELRATEGIGGKDDPDARTDWELGSCTVLVTPKSSGVHVVLLVSSE